MNIWRGISPGDYVNDSLRELAKLEVLKEYSVSEAIDLQRLAYLRENRYDYIDRIKQDMLSKMAKSIPVNWNSRENFDMRQYLLIGTVMVIDQDKVKSISKEAGV